MIEDRQNLNEILERIIQRNQSESDISILRNSLKFDGEKCFIQMGNDNISIGTAKNISIQRIYNGHNLEAIREVFKTLLQENKPMDNTPMGLLRRFEQTEEYLNLKKNSEKIGYEHECVLRDLIGSFFLIYLGFNWIVFIGFKDLFEYGFSMFIIFAIILGFLVLSLGLTMLYISFEKVSRGKWIIEKNRVLSQPVYVVRCPRTFGFLNSVILQTSDGHRFEIDTHPFFYGSKIAEGDMGVVYMRNDIIGSRKRKVVVGFRHAPTI